MNSGEIFFISVLGVEIPVFIRHNPNARCLRLRVLDSGVRITIPRFCLAHEWRDFLSKHKNWIFKKYGEMRKKREAREAFLRPVDGAKIPYKGDFYPLKITESEKPVREVWFDDKCVSVRIPAQDGKSLYPAETETSIALAYWYRGRAVELALKVYEYWKDTADFRIAALRVKDLRSGWGSCTASGKISLNWRLIMAPEEVFEYVFVHELCHLRILRHNMEFWNSVRRYIPDFTGCRIWLKKNEDMLMNFPGGMKLPGVSLTEF